MRSVSHWLWSVSHTISSPSLSHLSLLLSGFASAPIGSLSQVSLSLSFFLSLSLSLSLTPISVCVCLFGMYNLWFNFWFKHQIFWFKSVCVIFYLIFFGICIEIGSVLNLYRSVCVGSVLNLYSSMVYTFGIHRSVCNFIDLYGIQSVFKNNSIFWNLFLIKSVEF